MKLVAAILPCVMAVAFAGQVLAFSTDKDASPRSPVIAESEETEISTAEMQLQEHHILLTIPALVSALKNSDPLIRGLAAFELSQLKAVNAIPSLRSALTAETEPRARMDIAYSLILLGDVSGLPALEQACDNSSMAYWLRVQAADYMLRANYPTESCRKSLLALLQSRVDSDSEAEVIQFLPNYRGLSEGETQKMIEVVKEFLTDPVLRVRSLASHSLAELGDKSVIPYLEEMAARKENQPFRREIEADIKWLQKKEMQSPVPQDH